MRYRSIAMGFALFLVLAMTAPAASLAPQEGPEDIMVANDVPLPSAEWTLDEWNSLQQWSLGVWSVRFNPRTGIPLSILGTGNINRPDLEPVELAKVFLSETASLFRRGETFGDLEFKRVLSEGGSHHVYFGQLVDNMPLFGCGLSVHISPKGEVRQVNGEYVPRPEVRGSWSISKDRALAASLTTLGCSRHEGEEVIDKVLYFDGTAAVKAWRVQVATAEPPGAWEMVVDGSDGQLLCRLNHIDFFTGRGSTYKTHPLSGDVVVRDLLYMIKANALKGAYIRVYNEDEKDASEDDGRYVYEPDNTHFDEAMVYCHVNLIHDYFAALGFNGLDKAKLKAKVHVGDDYDNAYYHPWYGGIYFGDGNKLNDLAKEAGVIHHEYTHAVTRKINSLRYGEAGAMNEAFSDYFACTQDEEPQIGEWCCERLERECFRDLTSTKHYPEDIEGEVHRDGEIYGATLWDLRKALGKQVTDILAHRSRYHLKTGCKFVDGLEAMVAVDLDVYNGEHEAVIRQVYAKRGISTGERTLVDMLIEKRFYKLLEQTR